jgi:perosamine synthetase
MGSKAMIYPSCDRECGSIGALGTFSFFPSHTITTGEGGMIATNDDDYAALARRLRNHGKISDVDFHFDVIGFNGKMTSIQAAIGLAMMDDIDQIIEGRRRSFFALGGVEDKWKEFISPHAFPVTLDSKEERDAMLAKLRAERIECRNFFSCIPTQESAYAHLGIKSGGVFSATEDFCDRSLYVPCHQGLTDDDIAKIKSIIGEAVPA